MIGFDPSVPSTVPRSSFTESEISLRYGGSGSRDKPTEGVFGAEFPAPSPALSGDTEPLLHVGRDVPRRPLRATFPPLVSRHEALRACPPFDSDRDDRLRGHPGGERVADHGDHGER